MRPTVRPRPALAALAALLLATACGAIAENRRPICRPDSPTLLMAESVQAARKIPCVRSLPVGWTFAGFEAHDRGAWFALEADAGEDEALGDEHRVEVSLASRCGDRDRGERRRSDEPGTELFVRSGAGEPTGPVWTYVFPGGCARYRFTLASGASPAEVEAAIRNGVSFIDRAALLERLEDEGLAPLEPVGD